MKIKFWMKTIKYTFPSNSKKKLNKDSDWNKENKVERIPVPDKKNLSSY